MAIVNTQFWKLAALNLKTPTLNAGKIGLYTNNFALAYTTILANLTQPTDTGYAAPGPGPQTPGFLSAVNFNTTDGQTTSPNLTWTWTLSGGAFSIYGYFQQNVTPALLFAERNAAAPVSVSAAGQTYTVAPVYDDGDY